MTAAAFQITRQDGRSNARVLLDYFEGGEPGRVYTYEELASALAAGCGRSFARREVCALVTGPAFGRLLKEQQRTLYNVRNVGYRLAHANEHSRLALVRKRKSDSQLVRGMRILENVRTEEMGAEERNAHQGVLMVVGALYQSQRAMERRLRAVETAIGMVGRADE